MRLLGYCVLANHWHLVVWPRGDGDLSEAEKGVGLKKGSGAFFIDGRPLTRYLGAHAKAMAICQRGLRLS